MTHFLALVLDIEVGVVAAVVAIYALRRGGKV